jgi:DNA-binding NtrC family response regulator
MPISAKSPAFIMPLASSPKTGLLRVLVADDQQHILDALELLLKPQGYKVDMARSPALAREALAYATYDAASSI